VVDKLRTYNQIPEISNLNGNFLSFDTTAAPLAFQSVAATPASRTIFEKKLFGVTENLPADTALISLYYRNLKALRLFGSDSAAFDILKKVRGSRDSALYYEKMRAAFVRTALNEDNTIMFRYLNQDINPWKTKYDDMEQGLRICLALQETLDTLDFKYTEVTSRYLFYQAMAWYEYAKFADKRSDRSDRLSVADTLINQVSIIGTQPVVALFQKNLIENGLEFRRSDTLLQRIVETAPEWRLPRLYSGDLSTYLLLLRDDYRTSVAPFDTLEALDAWVASGKTPDASRIPELFSDNPQLAEDVFLQYALREKNVEKALKRHRQLLERSLRTLDGLDNIPVSGEPEFFGDLKTYSRQNRLAFAKLAEEQFRLAALTGDARYERVARELFANLSAAGADISESSFGKEDNPALPDVPLAESFTDPMAGKFMLVRGGTFMMGCTNFKDQCYTNEKPEHSVTLDNYYMGETEVTQKQWRAVMGADVPNIGFPCDECPVERVSWDDAVLFIQKLNTVSAVKYRLPTEAEWEYAAKGGHLTNKKYNYAGGFDPDKVAWSSKNAKKSTHPVGKLQPNELGLYDMSGNVSEWCSDEYREYPGNPYSNLLAADNGITRVYRGGSWDDKPLNCRVTNRSSLKPDTRFNSLGFRLVRQAR
jgi:formylglycine-generating enzyme required for sulfatase activity